jgi:hydrogenase nickel incorporation protein HypA/HybF
LVSMHEWALAEAVLAAASQTAQKEGLKKVTEVRICIGEMQQIEKDILCFALSNLRPAEFAETKFEVERERAELKCNACGYQWLFNRKKLDKSSAEAVHFVPEVAHAYIRCPKCASPDFEIVKGRGVWLKTIKGVK